MFLLSFKKLPTLFSKIKFLKIRRSHQRELLWQKSVKHFPVKDSLTDFCRKSPGHMTKPKSFQIIINSWMKADESVSMLLTAQLQRALMCIFVMGDSWWGRQSLGHCTASSLTTGWGGSTMCWSFRFHFQYGERVVLKHSALTFRWQIPMTITLFLHERLHYGERNITVCGLWIFTWDSRLLNCHLRWQSNHIFLSFHKKTTKCFSSFLFLVICISIGRSRRNIVRFCSTDNVCFFNEVFD